MFVASFVQHGNAIKAYEAGGYVGERDGVKQRWLKQCAYSVLRGKAVRAAILEHEEQRASLDEDKQREYSELEALEAARLSRLLLTEGGASGAPGLPVGDDREQVTQGLSRPNRRTNVR